MDPTGMFENGGGDWDKGLFSWTENARNNEESDINIFEKSVLILLDIINGDFRINFDNIDIRGGGDSGSANDFGQDMAQENGYNDMRNDAGQDSYQNDGPGPRVTNNSNYPIHILDEHSNDVYVLQPHKTYSGEFDGIAMPHLNKSEVLKVSNHNSVTVTNKGYDVNGDNLRGSVAQFLKGGLKDKSWLQSFEGGAESTPRGTVTLVPRDQYSLEHWGALFNALKR